MQHSELSRVVALIGQVLWVMCRWAGSLMECTAFHWAGSCPHWLPWLPPHF